MYTVILPRELVFTDDTLHSAVLEHYFCSKAGDSFALFVFLIDYGTYDDSFMLSLANSLCFMKRLIVFSEMNEDTLELVVNLEEFIQECNDLNLDSKQADGRFLRHFYGTES
jgi:hypothetical protein